MWQKSISAPHTPLLASAEKAARSHINRRTHTSNQVCSTQISGNQMKFHSIWRCPSACLLIYCAAAWPIPNTAKIILFHSIPIDGMCMPMRVGMCMPLINNNNSNDAYSTITSYPYVAPTTLEHFSKYVCAYILVCVSPAYARVDGVRRMFAVTVIVNSIYISQFVFVTDLCRYGLCVGSGR